jgi:hypothetical protein
MAQPVTVCTCEAVNKAIDQWKGLYTTNVSRSIWVMTVTYNTAHVILKVAGVSRRLHRRLRQVSPNSREAQVDHASLQTSPWVNTASDRYLLQLRYAQMPHRFQENIEISRSLIAFGRAMMTMRFYADTMLTRSVSSLRVPVRADMNL